MAESRPVTAAPRRPRRRRPDPERARLREIAYRRWAHDDGFDVEAAAAVAGVSVRTVIGWRTAHGWGGRWAKSYTDKHAAMAAYLAEVNRLTAVLNGRDEAGQPTAYPARVELAACRNLLALLLPVFGVGPITDERFKAAFGLGPDGTHLPPDPSEFQA